MIIHNTVFKNKKLTFFVSVSDSGVYLAFSFKFEWRQSVNG